MAQITGGKVTFGRTVQPAQYESKKSEVEISFVLAEGEEIGDWLDKAASLAQDKALELVGLKRAEPRAGKPEAQPTPGTIGGKEAYAAKEATASAPAPAAERKRPGRPPNPDKVKPAEPAKVEAADPADMVDDTVIDTGAETPQAEAIRKAKEAVAAAQAAKDEADLASMMGTEEPITDKQLIEKIGHKNKSLADKNAGIPQPRKIKELISKYATHAHSIPAEKRAEFLAKLEELV